MFNGFKLTSEFLKEA